MIDQNEYLLTRENGSGLRAKDMQFKKVKEKKWLYKITCCLFGHWHALCPDGSGDTFCERRCGK